MKLPPKASVGSGQPSVWITALERTLHLPHLLHAEREELRVGGADLLPLAPRLAQEPARPLGDHRHAPGEVGRLGVARPGLARTVEPRRRGADAAHRRAVHQQRVHREPGEQVDAERFGALAEPADDLADRGGVVAAVVHRGRRRDPLRATLGHEVDGFGGNGLAEREVGGLEVGEQLAERAGIDDRAREIVLAQALGLLEHADVEVGHAAAALLVALHQPRQLDRAGEPGRPGADDQHVHLDRLGARRVTQDQAVERNGGLVADRQDRMHDGSW